MCVFPYIGKEIQSQYRNTFHCFISPVFIKFPEILIFVPGAECFSF